MTLPWVNFSSPVEYARVENPNHIRADDVFFNAYPFWMHLHTYTAIDACVFTYEPGFCKSLPMRRVVCNKISNGLAVNVQVRAASNLHAKMYLCYNGRRLSKVFMGSWNLVKPTQLEVITRIPAKANASAREWYDLIWEQAKQISA